MAKARFQIRSKNDPTKSVPIYLVAEHQGKEILKYPTGVSVTPKQWNEKTKEIRKVSDLPYEKMNQTLNGLMSIANRTFADLNADNLPITKEALRSALDIYTNKNAKQDFQNDFLGFIQFEIGKLPSKINMTTQRRFSKQTLSKYNCLAVVVSEIVGRTKLNMENIDMNFYYKFIGHLQNKGFQPNTIGSKYVAPLKTMLAEAEMQGYKVNNAFHTKGYKVPNEETFKIYLNDKEIETIERLDLSKIERLERVRDIFLVGYYTGQRFGDYSKFNKSQFENDKIKLLQNKTAKRVEIPLVGKVIEIMKKYDWKLPVISQTHFNEYIKEVAQLAEINEKISHTRNIGSRKETVQYEKWQLVSSHTARRSFATNMYMKRELQMLHIMKITGHTTAKSFMNYICFSDEDNSRIMREIMEGKKQPVPLAKVV